jgi:ParB/RepB/Spo0J family partition protein
MKKLSIKPIPLDQIKVGTRFREELGDIESLAQSLESEGLINPITLDSDHNLLAGGRRLAAAQLLKWETISANIMRIDSEGDLRIIELVENVQRKDLSWAEQANLVNRINELMKTQDPGWTQNKTADLLKMSPGHISDQIMVADISESIPGLSEATTFKDAVKIYRSLCTSIAETELSERLQHRAEVSLQSEETGALSEHDQFVLLNANSYQIKDVFDGLNEVSFDYYDYVEIDPPYDSAGFDPKYKKTKLEIYGDRTYFDFINTLVDRCYDKMSRNSFMLLWFPTQDYPIFAEILDAKMDGFDRIPVIWYKNTQPAGDIEKTLSRRYESFFVAWKGKPVLQIKGLANVFEYGAVPNTSRWHPVQRPLELMLRLSEIFCPRNGNTLIPFAGSGTSINAHYLRNPIPNSCIGFDINEQFRTRYLANLSYPTKGADDVEAS